MNRLLIVDGHAYAYRAYHAIRDLRSGTGQPTNAIYGFIKMFTKMRSALMPTHLVVVWDGGLDAGRLQQMPSYKAQRPPMPDDLAAQLDEIESFLKATGICQFRQEGVEADDYIGTAARWAEQMNWSVIIASSDKDFMQLVSDRVGLFNPNDKTGKIWGRAEVVAKAGVEPEQIVGWLALMGDAVDNLPGVPGIGPKTSARLINEFGSIEGIYLRLAKIDSEKIRQSLSESRTIVERNVKMVQLADLGLPLTEQEFFPAQLDVPMLKSLYARWGFKGLLAELEAAATPRQEELI